MSKMKEIWVDRTSLRKTKSIERTIPALDEGEVLVAIDKFGLTANNVSYAVSGDAIGYWQYYPAEDNWGKVPVWGFADVIESKCAGVLKGERFWGFYPMASHVVLRPGNIGAREFTDITPHRTKLPALYNQYSNVADDPEFIKKIENERCFLFPLFVTSYVLYDYFIDNDFFGASQILIGSVSSKTGFGLAHLLYNDKNVKQKVIGLTSQNNVAFVEKLNVCNEIILYGQEDKIDANQPTGFVDMSGDGALIQKLHHHLGDNMVESCIVGATHWEKARNEKELPGARPKFFFAPSQIAKREKDWGRGVAMQKASTASAAIAASIKNDIEMKKVEGAEAAASIWQELLDNKIPPYQGLVISLS